MRYLRTLLLLVPTIMLFLVFNTAWANENENYEYNNYPHTNPSITKTPSPTKTHDRVTCDDLIANPSTGISPLTVNFTIQHTGADEARMRYGQFNLGFNWVYLGNVFTSQYTYTNPGIYTPHAQIKKTNSNNWVGPEPHCKVIIEVKKPTITPTITISVTPTITISPTISLTPTPFDEEVTPTPHEEEVTPTPTPTNTSGPTPTDKPSDNGTGGGGTGGANNTQTTVQPAVLGTSTLAQTGSLEENIINIGFAVSFSLFGLIIRNKFSQA